MVESRWLRWIGPGVDRPGRGRAHRIDDARRRATGRGCRAPAPARRATARGRRREPAPVATGGPAPRGVVPTRSAARSPTERSRGQRLAVGVGDGRRRARRRSCRRNRSRPGPFGRIVLVGSDDGTASRLQAVDVATGCAWAIAAERDVIRRATVDPAGAGDLRDARRSSEPRRPRRLAAPARRPRTRPTDPRSAPGRRPLRPHVLDRVHVGPCRMAGSPSSRAARSHAGRGIVTPRAATDRRPGRPRTSASWSVSTATAS